ncbi:hypothetical protein AB4342_01355 [Vibrio breoganii]
MTNNGNVENVHEVEVPVDFSQFDFTSTADIQEEPQIQDDGLTEGEAFSFDEIDEDGLGDEATDPSFNHNKEELDQEELFDEEDLNEFEAEQQAGILDTVAKVANNWEHIPEDAVLFDGMTKSEVQAAVSSKQDNSLYNEEFNNFKAHVDKGYEQINASLYEAMSETDITLQELHQKKSQAHTMEQRGAIDKAIEQYSNRKDMLRGKASEIANEVNNLKAQAKKQEMINFAQSAKREYGAQWVAEVDKISEGLPQPVLNTLKDNPSVEMFNLIRDAKAYRSGKAANAQAVRDAGKRVKTSAKSVRSNKKGTAPVTNNKAKLAKALDAGHVSSAEVFAALED